MRGNAAAAGLVILAMHAVALPEPRLLELNATALAYMPTESVAVALLGRARIRPPADLVIAAARSFISHEIDVGVSFRLDQGDVLFFHCRLFHAAGQNRGSKTKFSLVFTYRSTDNRPFPGTRSASLPDTVLSD